MVSAALAIAATVVSSRYGAPAMLMGLLLGMACHFVGDIKRMQLGLDLMAGPALRVGVALLALRLTFSDLVQTGLAIRIVSDRRDWVDDYHGRDQC
jgi:uncharacterized membrane protein YadS